MMTGMGDDGTIAMKDMFDNNAYTVAQNEESCVVFGMPMKAIKAGSIGINKVKLQSFDQEIEFELLQNKYLLVQKGKKNYYLIVIE